MSTNSRNRHLNFYQFFSETKESETSPEIKENNLTRALAICLQNNPLFFKTFIEEILGSETAASLLNHVENDELVYINIQERTTDIRNWQDEISQLYGVSLTTEKINTQLGPAFKSTEESGGRITDLAIQIKDVVIIIVAKPHGQDWSDQLIEQLAECGLPPEKVKTPQSLTWEDVLEMLISTENVYKVLGNSSIFIRDFIRLIETYYVGWLPVLPFSNLSFPKSADSESFSKHYKRLEQIKNAMNVELKQIGYRTIIPINVLWASEVSPYFEEGKQNNLSVYVWPGSIKGQGWHLYYKDQSWQDQKSLQVGQYNFDLKIIPEIVFRHISGVFVSQIKLAEGRSPVHTLENFKEKSGKWERERWSELEEWLDENLNTLAADWRSQCDWEGKFINTNRSYLTLSLGFEVSVKVPYSLLQDMDRKKDDLKPVARLLSDITRALENLVV